MLTLFESLYIGMSVYDTAGNFGTVMIIDDIHNVWIEFDNGSSGYYCVDEKCHYYDQLVPTPSLKINYHERRFT